LGAASDFLGANIRILLNSGTGGGMISQKKVRGIRFWVREYPDSSINTLA
jgi:hypothetical protein